MKYLWKILCHKWFILVVGYRIGGVSLWRLLVHDLSKFRPSEFGPYRAYFTKNLEDRSVFSNAYRLHCSRNPHHWEYWLNEDRNPSVMPYTYVREMVIDWHAASRGYTGSWDLTPWLLQNYRRMTLHPETVKVLGEILREVNVVDVTDQTIQENTVCRG